MLSMKPYQIPSFYKYFYSVKLQGNDLQIELINVQGMCRHTLKLINHI